MNYLYASIRGIKFQKKQIPNSKEIKYAASSEEVNNPRGKPTRHLKEESLKMDETIHFQTFF